MIKHLIVGAVVAVSAVAVSPAMVLPLTTTRLSAHQHRKAVRAR
jgi:hypothetical protein